MAMELYKDEMEMTDSFGNMNGLYYNNNSNKMTCFLFLRAGCSISVKDFKASWRSGVVFLAIQYALRPDLVDLSKARTRSNKQNLEEAFRIAETELRIPRLLEPDGE